MVASGGVADLHCPVCANTVLATLVLPSQKPLRLKRCGGCNGVWVDGPSWPLLPVALARKKTLKASEEKERKKQAAFNDRIDGSVAQGHARGGYGLFL